MSFGYQDPATPSRKLESLQTGTESGLPVEAEAGNPSASLGATTRVTAAAVDTQCLAANAARLGGTLYNDSDRDACVKLGAGASLTSFWTKVPPDGERELPARYVGAVHAMWLPGVTGAMNVTERVPA